MAGDGLGGMIPPDEGAEPKSTWSSLVADPNTKAAMNAAVANMAISMGAQMLVPQWGGPMANLGMAIGKGGESLGKTADAAMGTEQDIRNFNAKEHEGEANRASHEKIAKIGATSREEVAQLKTEGMLERAKLIHGPQNNQEMKIYADAANRYIHEEKANQLITKKTDDQIRMEADAVGKERLRGARESTGLRSQGQTLPAEGGAENPAGIGPLSTPAPAGSAASGKTSASKPTWDSIKDNPLVKEALTTAAGRKALVKERPDLEKEIMSHAIPYEN